ncbi:hypothetical protein CK203_048338 [Vitis vinifera]|uniref:Uncharacterized protein n=1 Tax=Vitis vinifera TaxID=29760 RepID=A0A438HRJ6_VITVI|nr:hypothetical protein CK203_048338 [Vitis vinifera]
MSVANIRKLQEKFRCAVQNGCEIFAAKGQNFRSPRLISQPCKNFLQLGVIFLQWLFLFASPPCIPDLLMAKDFKALVLHVSELSIALPWIPKNSPQSWIALSPKAYQVLEILENPTFKSPPKGSQEVNQCISMDGDHLPYQVLAQHFLSSNQPPPEPSVHHIPSKGARTSGPGETSRHAQLDPQTPANSQRSSGIAPEAIIKRPMVTVPPIEGNSDCRARPFHFELYFDIEAMEFFYPRVAMNFYQSMTTQGAQSLTTIHFSIDGRQGILEARHIAEALHIPYEPEDSTHFWEWSLYLSGTWSASYPRGLLEIHSFYHLVQRRGAILDALFRISEGFYFRLHHLIMAALLHFEKKVHRKQL